MGVQNIRVLSQEGMFRLIKGSFQLSALTRISSLFDFDLAPGNCLFMGIAVWAALRSGKPNGCHWETICSPHSNPSDIRRWAHFWSSRSKNISEGKYLSERLSTEKPPSLRFWGSTAGRYSVLLVSEIRHNTERAAFQQWILSPLEGIKELHNPQSLYFWELQISDRQNKVNCLNKRHCSPEKNKDKTPNWQQSREKKTNAPTLFSTLRIFSPYLLIFHIKIFFSFSLM